MGDLLLAGGEVVNADSSFRGDVLIRDGVIAEVGVDLNLGDCEVVDVSGAKLMPGFIDAHTHFDMPFGGTVTIDDFEGGSSAAIAGGTTTVIDFALQDIGAGLADGVRTWQQKAEGKSHVDYGFHIAITNLTDEAKQEIPQLPSLGVSSI